MRITRTWTIPTAGERRNICCSGEFSCRNETPSVPASAANVSGGASASKPSPRSPRSAPISGSDSSATTSRNGPFIRDYAKAIGLDADDLVDEFCRLFPLGDRRAARLIKAQAEIIGHQPGVLEDPALIPREGDRRSSARERKAQSRARRLRLAPRAVAAGVDVVCTLSLAMIGPAVGATGFWASVGVTAVIYYSVATIFTGATPGSHAVDYLRHRVPTLFAVQDRRAHA